MSIIIFWWNCLFRWHFFSYVYDNMQMYKNPQSNYLTRSNQLHIFCHYLQVPLQISRVLEFVVFNATNYYPRHFCSSTLLRMTTMFEAFWREQKGTKSCEIFVVCFSYLCWKLFNILRNFLQGKRRFFDTIVIS